MRETLARFGGLLAKSRKQREGGSAAEVKEKSVPAETGQEEVPGSDNKDANLDDGVQVRVVVCCGAPPQPNLPYVDFSPAASVTDRVAIAFPCSPSPSLFWCNRILAPESSTLDAFEEAKHVVHGVAEGTCGVLLFSTSPAAATSSPASGSGMTELSVRCLFDCIDQRSASGDVFLIEASLLEIRRGQDGSEQMVDLLSENSVGLRFVPDPLDSSSWACDGLRRVPVHSADEARGCLARGLQQCKAEASMSVQRVSLLHVENLAILDGTAAPVVQRSKLAIIDLGASILSEEAVSKLTSGHAAMPRNSSLAMLLHTCLLKDAQLFFLACVRTELQHASESAAALDFAQKVLFSRGPSTTNSACRGISQKLADEEHKVRICQPEKVHEPLETLPVKASKADESAAIAQPELQSARSARAEESIPLRQPEQAQICSERDVGKDELTMEAKTEMEFVPEPGAQENAARLEQILLQKSLVEESVARVHKARRVLKDADVARHSATLEASRLRAEVARAEERVKLLQEQNEDLNRDRAAIEEERQRGDQLRQKLAAAQVEVSKCRAQVEVNRTQLARLDAHDSTATGTDLPKEERAQRRSRRMELESQVENLQQETKEVRHATSVLLLKAEVQKGEACEELHRKIQQMEAECASLTSQLSQATQLNAKLEVEERLAQQREEALRQQGSAPVLEECRRELEEVKQREEELKSMLSELQDELLMGAGDGGEESEADELGP